MPLLVAEVDGGGGGLAGGGNHHAPEFGEGGGGQAGVGVARAVVDAQGGVVFQRVGIGLGRGGEERPEGVLPREGLGYETLGHECGPTPDTKNSFRSTR